MEKYILGAARVVGGKPPQKAWLRAQRLWLLIPVLVMLLPETLIRRCCAANALITAELGFVLANCARQLSFGEYYAARTRRVHSRTDAWAQVATACSRSLPLTSALALTNTLISTTLGAVSVSFGGIFPIFGLAVCIRAVQKAVESRESAVLTRKEGRDAQQLGQTFPPYSKLDVKDPMLSPRHEVKESGRVCIMSRRCYSIWDHCSRGESYWHQLGSWCVCDSDWPMSACCRDAGIDACCSRGRRACLRISDGGEADSRGSEDAHSEQAPKWIRQIGERPTGTLSL